MDTGSPETSKIRFGIFELDSLSGELLKAGTKVRLQEQPFQVLKTLLERSGKVVTREELQQLLWPDDTFVDFEDGLSTAVRKVRTALGDSASNPRFIETLPKRGYRFIAPVTLPAGTDAPEPVAVSSAGPHARQARSRRSWRTLAVAGWASAATIAILFLVGKSERPETGGRFMKFSLAPGEDTHDPEVSPDGRYVAYAKLEGEAGIWVQALDEEQPRRILGTEGGRNPFWSPDSRTIGFRGGSLLKRVAVTGGSAPVEISRIPVSRGIYTNGTWREEDDRIYFTGWSVAASGGQLELIEDRTAPTNFTLFGTSDPVALPVPSRRLLLLHSQDGRAGTVRQGTYLRDLDNFTNQWLFSGRSAVYSPTGHIIYQDDSATRQLRAVAFSLERLELSGEPFVIARNATAPSVSNDGTLVYLIGASPSMQVVRRDRAGRPIGEPSGPFQDPRYLNISPSGDKVAFTAIFNNEREVLILELQTPNAEARRLTFNDVLEGVTLWSPDGSQILYRDPRAGEKHFVLHPADGGSAQHLKVDGLPAEWWGNGKTEYLIFHGEEGIEYGKAEDGGDFTFHSFVADGYDSNLTHDGRFIVYSTGYPNDARLEVRTFEEGRGPWQVSLPNESLGISRASRFRNEIFYGAGDGLMAVEYATEPTFRVTKRTTLFPLRTRSFAVAPDGESFVLLEPYEEDKPTLRVTQNWYEEFRDRERD